MHACLVTQSCLTLRPYGPQPARLLCPWGSLGKNTGVGCLFLLQCVKVKSESEVAQSCPTLCDPIDGSPPGSPVPGILKARTLEWVAISFSNAWKWRVKVKSLSRVWLLASPWTAAHQAPPSMGFSRQEARPVCIPDSLKCLHWHIRSTNMCWVPPVWHTVGSRFRYSFGSVVIISTSLWNLYLSLYVFDQHETGGLRRCRVVALVITSCQSLGVNEKEIIKRVLCGEKIESQPLIYPKMCEIHSCS